MKSIRQFIAWLFIAVMCMGMFGSRIFAYDANSIRDDYVWLFPLEAQYYYTAFSDWAGCPGSDTCYFCNVKHEQWAAGDPHSGQYPGHNGWDVGVPSGTEVFAAATGEAYYAENVGTRGNVVVIETKAGNDYSYYHYYQHLSKSFASGGANVNVGDTIALSGNSGGADAHLHMGIVMGRSGKIQSDSDISNVLNELEKYGWIVTSGYAEGRILNNPAQYNDAGFPEKDAWGNNGNSSVIAALKQHYGSVHYTFDTSKVTVGISIPKSAIPVSLELEVDKSNGSVVRSGPGQKYSVVERMNNEESLHAYAWQKNEYGNTWYLIGNEQWIYSGNIKLSKVNSTSSIAGVDAPSSIRRGNYYTIRGTINAQDATSITAIVVDKSGKEILSVSDTLDNGRYSLTSSKIDYGLTFNTLAVNSYTLSYVVHEEIDTGISCVSRDVTIFSRDFEVR